jgi:Ca2+-binding EF-hand superfamily protein
MLAIDKDGGGSVDRLEWIAYLVSPDEATGASYFDFELRNSFMHFDDNADGFINLGEFANFLKEDVKHLLASASM